MFSSFVDGLGLYSLKYWAYGGVKNKMDRTH